MAKDKNHVYSIDLDVKSTAASKQAFKELQTAFDNGKKSTKELNLAYIRMASTMKDTSVLDEQYNKVIKDRIKDREKELDKLKAQQIKIMSNTKMSEQLRANLLENNRINQSKIQNEIDKLNKSNLVQLKLEREKAKAAKEAAERLKEEELRRKKLSTYVKADLVALRDKVKSQLKFIAMLKTTEGRYNAIKKTMAGMVKLSGKLAAGMAGGALALGGALAGAAAGTADSLVEKEQAMASLKSGIDPAVVDAVYVKAGGDYESIVAAVNSLSDVTKDNALLVQGAVLELRNPGVGKLLLSTSNMGINDGSKLTQAISQIKKQTGVQDMSAALEAATKSASVSTKKVSQVDYLQAYAALQQRGFDEEQIEKIVNDVSLKKGNFVDNLNKTDLRKYTDDAQMKIRLGHTPLELQDLGLKNQSVADAMLRLLNKPQKSQAQSTAEKLRELEIKKNELLVQFLPVVEAVVDGLKKALDSDMVKKIADGLVKFLTDVVPGLVDWIPKLIDAIEKIAEGASSTRDLIDKNVDAMIGNWSRTPEEVAKLNPFYKEALEAIKARNEPAGGKKAQGGVITAPSLVGEAGPELVLPLDYSRAGRTSQIIQNFNTNQSFNMASNQQTPLAFSQAVGNNRFVTRVNGL